MKFDRIEAKKEVSFKPNQEDEQEWGDLWYQRQQIETKSGDFLLTLGLDYMIMNRKKCGPLNTIQTITALILM